MKKISVKWLENPWLKNQVETHLIFQLFAKYIPFGFMLLAIVFANIWESNVNSSSIFTIFYNNIFFLIVIFIFFLLPRLQQATFGWIITKFVIGVLAFLIIVVGALSSWSAGKKDAVPNLLLGIIWLPLLEFFPKITAKQKYLTAARIILSIPVIYLGIHSGEWHWG